VRADRARPAISKVEASVGGRSVSSGDALEEFSADKKTPAVYFLVQRSANPGDSLRAIQSIAKHEKKRMFGVGSFGGALDEHAGMGANESEIRRLEGKIRLEEVSKPANLFIAAAEAMEKLSRVRADRKSIVLLANGQNNSQTRRDDVIKLAKDRNILVQAIYVGSGGRTGNKAELELLAKEAGGVVIDSVACKNRKQCAVELAEDVVPNILGAVESGGTLKLSAGAVGKGPVTITATFSNGDLARVENVAVNALNPAGLEDTSFWGTTWAWLNRNQTPALATSAVALGLLLLGAVMLSRRARAPLDIPHAPDSILETDRTSRFANGGSGGYASGNAATMITGGDTVIMTPTNDRHPPDKVYAWLQFLDASSTRVPIGSTSVRIGRHQDNDICLQNKTVHRQHAVLHMTHDRRFSIRDLGTTNGVVVNNQRTQQKDLADGDLIELGEVRLRFFSNPEVMH
jgi:pSer/pThr/pTyr-binding forkhead associated (FHA) protein